MRGAECADRAHHAGAGAGIEQLQCADRRQHHRQPQLAAEHLDRGIDLGDIAQHPRPERDLVQRHAVAAHGGLGLGGADDVVPGILVEVGAGLAHEFMQVLELFAAGAEFNGLRLDAGRLVHVFLPEKCLTVVLDPSPIVSRAFAPSRKWPWLVGATAGPLSRAGPGRAAFRMPNFRNSA